ncbi:hypothetical protein WA026_010397 [Henosepilachna vigintioctopunctata]|uniref:Uncharacterized protein n=1 Tax=Henosepilachna vigintioctopunctata TaxID=420089 RepID=A0AAW1VE62_9CUCU
MVRSSEGSPNAMDCFFPVCKVTVQSSSRLRKTKTFVARYSVQTANAAAKSTSKTSKPTAAAKSISKAATKTALKLTKTSSKPASAKTAAKSAAKPPVKDDLKKAQGKLGEKVQKHLFLNPKRMCHLNINLRLLERKLHLKCPK